MRFRFVILFCFLFCMAFICAETNVVNVRGGSTFNVNYTVLNFSTNSSEYWHTDIGNLNDVNSTQFENNAGTLSIIASWLQSSIQSVACSLTGCTMQGAINMNGNNFIDFGNATGGQINITGNMIIQDRIYVGYDPSEVSATINPGDAAFRGNVIIGEGSSINYPKQYGATQYLFSYGDNDPSKRKIYYFPNASINKDTNEFCDYTNNPFFENSTEDFLTTIISDQYGLTQIAFEITEYYNASCVYIDPIALGGDLSQDITGISYVTYPEPVVFTGDQGYIINNVNKYKLNFKNTTKHTNFQLLLDAGANNVHAFHIESDIKGYNNFLNDHHYLYSSQDSNYTITRNFIIDADLTNFNNGVYRSLDLDLSGLGTGMDTTALRVSPDFDNIITVGSPEDINIIYYDNTTATTEITSSSGISIFEEDDSIIYIGNTVNFSKISFSLSTVSSAPIDAVLYYCNSSGEYEVLSATDSSSGLTSSGSFSFISPSDRGTCNKDINGVPFANTTNFTYVAIQRTRNNIVNPPVLNSFAITGDEAYVFYGKDSLKLSPVDTAPVPCPANIGAMYFDISEDGYCQCKTTGWKVMEDGTDCT